MKTTYFCLLAATLLMVGCESGPAPVVEPSCSPNAETVEVIVPNIPVATVQYPNQYATPSEPPPDATVSITPKGRAILLLLSAGKDTEDEVLQSFAAACERDPELFKATVRELAHLARQSAAPVFVPTPTKRPASFRDRFRLLPSLNH